MVNPKMKSVAKAAKETIDNRSIRRPRTMSLSDDLFSRLQRHCAMEGIAVSEVIDALMEAYLPLVEEEK
jgi:hypothetical protein